MFVAVAALLACTACSSPSGQVPSVATSANTQPAPFDSAPYRPSSDELRDIRRWISELAEIDKLELPMSGASFIQLPGANDSTIPFIGIYHGKLRSPAVEHLVALGPKALSSLLAALSDPTPTNVVLEPSIYSADMWYTRELALNSRSARERTVRDEHPKFFEQAARLENGIDVATRHVVTRGDIAFVLVGEIVNRDYRCARYERKVGCAINSPTHDAELAEVVRAIWSSKDSARALFDSLTSDFSSAYASKALQGLVLVEKLNVLTTGAGAARRLAYYFPLESRDLLVSVLDTVSPEENPQGDAMLARALSFSEDPKIVDAMRRLVARTTSIRCFQAALTTSFANHNAELVARRIRDFLGDRKAWQGVWDAELELLENAATFVPDRAQSIFADYLMRSSWEARDVAARALIQTNDRIAWAPALLAPVLDDRRDAASDYGPQYDRQPVLLCDEAAQAIARHLPGANYRLEGDRAHLDEQIVVLKRRILASR